MTHFIRYTAGHVNAVIRTQGRIVAMATAMLASAVGTSLEAQGSVSTLGFGYPVGGYSTRVSGTVGAFAEFDAITPYNPASIWSIQRSVLTMQTEPEFRTLTLNGVSEHSRTQRSPLMMLGSRISQRAVMGFSLSTFLDRSYATTGKGLAVVEGDTLATTDHIESKGAISDMRLAVGYFVNKRIQVGLGAHLFTGNNEVELSRIFADTLQFGSVLDTSRVTYFGRGLSVGGQALIVKGLTASASYRLGGRLETSRHDSVLTHASVPDRLGVGVRYDGIPGSIFAVNVEKVAWSAMRGLGTNVVTMQDATNVSVGAEVAGPKLMGNSVMIRAGYAKNSLPFGIGDNFAKEHRFGGGVGIPMPRNFATIDFSLQHASRTLSGSNVKEGAWLFGAGMQVRP